MAEKKVDPTPAPQPDATPAAKVTFVERPSDGRGIIIGTDHRNKMKQVKKPTNAWK